MKYIDADKLIAEIERRKKQDVTFRERSILIDIETAITSLQQEQPQVIDHICSRAGIPVPFMDGNQWSILKGDNIQVGVVGFGDTKEDALVDFIKNIPIQQDQPIGEEYTIEVGKDTHTLRVGSQSDIDNLIRQDKQDQPDGINGVVHHAISAHWIVTDDKQLATALKEFPEGTEVELFIVARKEDKK